MRWHCAEAQCENTKRRFMLFSYGNIIAMDTFITVDMYIFIVMAFLWTPLIKNQILRYVVYKPHLLLLLLLLVSGGGQKSVLSQRAWSSGGYCHELGLAWTMLPMTLELISITIWFIRNVTSPPSSYWLYPPVPEFWFPMPNGYVIRVAKPFN